MAQAASPSSGSIALDDLTALTDEMAALVRAPACRWKTAWHVRRTI